jgi:hypothetical protein
MCDAALGQPAPAVRKLCSAEHPERNKARNSKINKMNEKGIQGDVTVNRKIMRENENERKI